MNLKRATLIGVIAIGIQTLMEFYFMLLFNGTVGNSSVLKVISQPLMFLSSVGLLVFLIQLYREQPDEDISKKK